MSYYFLRIGGGDRMDFYLIIFKFLILVVGIKD